MSGVRMDAPDFASGHGSRRIAGYRARSAGGRARSRNRARQAQSGRDSGAVNRRNAPAVTRAEQQRSWGETPRPMWRLDDQGATDGTLHLLSGELVLELALLEADSCLSCVLDASRAARPGTGMRRSHRHVGNGRGCRLT